ncbi:MAG: hypothetical protein LPK07_01525 [Hymenobacteraceae bacterium]|nr:hypothetical protein [Hymenobacteraceae bacterium]MDX5480340.1 hypothetical protein [Hymenobacteraceae bacterium]
MKIIILLFALVFGFGATVKRTASDMKEMSSRMELNEYKHHPNLLPEVEIVAGRS